jgi:hypothetical protein
MKPPVIQIVPHPDARADGVTEQARILAAELRRAHGIDSGMLRIARPDAHSLELQLRAALRPGQLIVHYVNYGYAKRGCPSWLIAGLERWKSAHAQNRLLTVFHELYAFGPPWRSSFWLSPLQRALARRLAQIADAAVTSLPRYGRKLGDWGLSENKLAVRAVFSNVGEMIRPAPLAQRSRRMVVFGNAGVRTRLYQNGASALGAWARHLGIEEVVDVGPPRTPDWSLPGIRLRRAGLLAADELSALLNDCYAGAIAYPPGYLGKSTIFAAYCAHGLLPLVFSGGRRGEEEARPGEHYLLMDGAPPPAAETAQAVASQAHRWYMGHSAARGAEWLATKITAMADAARPTC